MAPFDEIGHYFRSITPFSPFTEALKQAYDDIMTKVALFKNTPPFLFLVKSFPDIYTDQKLFDMVYHSTIMQSWILEPEILNPNPFETHQLLEGVHRISLGIAWFNAADEAHRLGRRTRINLIVSHADEYIPMSTFDSFWQALPDANKGYFIKVYGTRHKMIQQFASHSADLARVAKGAPTRWIPYGSVIDAFAITQELQIGKARYKIWDMLEAIKTGKPPTNQGYRGKAPRSLRALPTKAKEAE